MKKQLGYLITTVLLAVNILGCNSTSQKVETGQGSDSIQVVTTLFYQYDFAKQIAGDHMNVELLLRAGQESHSYEPTPADIIAIQEADIFIYNGGTSELWVEKVLEGTDGVHIIRMMDYVDVVEEEIVEGMEHDDHDHDDDHDDEYSHDYDDDHDHDDEYSHDHDDDHYDDKDNHDHEDDGHDTDDNHNVNDRDTEDNHDDEDEHHDDHEHDDDEHIWTSPVNAQRLVQALINEFSTIDSEKAEIYKENGANYIAQIQEIDQAFREVVAQAARTTLVFGDRFPFRYFVDEYGLDYFAAFPGCSTETEPGVGTITFLLDKIKSEQIPVVYHLELSNEKIADTLCEGTGAKKAIFHTAHNITKEESAAGVSYVDLMRGNVESLKAGVK
jgi:ABC-type metal ion transport system, periplasmic component/surface adhesin